MKSTIIIILFLSWLSSVMGQADSCIYDKITGLTLHRALSKASVEAIAIYDKWRSKDSLIANGALLISSKIRSTITTIATSEYYPCPMLSYIKNYQDILHASLQMTTRDSTFELLNFINRDLSLKTQQRIVRSGSNEMGSFLITNPKTVKVSVIERSTGKRLQFFEVQVHPYFLKDPASIVRFGKLTDDAIQNIYPGWYKCWATNGRDTVSRVFTLNEKSVEPLIVEIPLDKKK